MAPIEIATSGDTILKFEGDLLVRSLSDADPVGRHYVVTVYSEESETTVRFVPVIEYFTNVDSDPEFSVAEVVQSVEDVEKFLNVFEPLEQLPCDRVESLTAEARQELTHHLFQLYDAAVIDVLGKISAEPMFDQPSSAKHKEA